MIVNFTDEEIALVKQVLQEVANAEWGATVASPSYLHPAYLRPILEKIAAKNNAEEVPEEWDTQP